MKELGLLLRKAREEQQISLNEISERTRIQAHHLEALESGDFSKFAGEVYLKGALRNYAEAVGLLPEEVLDHYRTLKGEPEPAEPDAAPCEKQTPTPRPYRGERGPSFVYGIVLLGLLLAAGGYWFATHYLQGGPVKPDDIEKRAEQENGAAPGGEKEEQDRLPSPATAAKIELSEAESTALETVFAVSNVTQLKLKLICNERCWVRVQLDGKEEFSERNLGQGEEMNLEAAEKIWIRLGHPGGIELTANDLPVEAVGRRSSAHNFIFVRK